MKDASQEADFRRVKGERERDLEKEIDLQNNFKFVVFRLDSLRSLLVPVTLCRQKNLLDLQIKEENSTLIWRPRRARDGRLPVVVAGVQGLGLDA